MVDAPWLEELDTAATPNSDHRDDAVNDAPVDADRTHSPPPRSGMTGIAYNAKLTSTPITSIDQLLEDPKLKGKMTLLSEMADTLGVVMKANGDDPAKVTDETFKRAIDRVKAAVDSGHVRQFTG